MCGVVAMDDLPVCLLMELWFLTLEGDRAMGQARFEFCSFLD